MHVQHLTEEQIRDYAALMLPPAALIQVSRHLENCSDCRKKIAAAFVPSNFPSELGASGHLQDNDMVDYAAGRGSSDQRAAVELHMAECSVCAADINDLTVFGNSIADRETQYTEGFLGSLRRAIRATNYRRFAWAAVVSMVAALILFHAAKSRQTPTIVKQSPGVRTIVPSMEDQTYQPLFAQSLAPTNPRLQLPMDKLRELPSHEVTLGGSDNAAPSITLLQPNDTFEFSQHPRFVWQSKSAAVKYTLRIATIERLPVATVVLAKHRGSILVTVRSASDQVVASYDTSSDTEWRVPSNLSLFQPSEQYLWTVETGDGNPTPDLKANQSDVGTFRKVDNKQSAEIVKAVAEFRSRPIKLGVVFASYGLLSEAREQFQKQLVANPHDAQAQRLLDLLDNETVSLKSDKR